MKQDRRVQKTVYLYQKALLELLKIKRLHDITVKELSDCASLHRGTFYTHYKDIAELLYSIEKDMIQTLESICQNKPLDPFHDLPYTVLNDVFSFLEEHKEVMIIFFAKDDYFVSEMKRILMMYCNHCCQHMYRDVEQKEYDFLSSYMVEGMIVVFNNWLLDSSEERQTGEEMALKLQRVMLLGVHALQK
jgi:AcrR family transcriptional regulator